MIQKKEDHRKGLPDKGLVLVFTGNGKGKTTAALGMALRAVGHGMKVLVIQFIKNFKNYGELETAKRLFPNLEIKSIGKGYVGIFGDKTPFHEHQKTAKEAFEFAKLKALTGEYDIIVLDEINIALGLDLLSSEEVIEFINKRPQRVHLVLTGRGALQKIIDVADLVTEMKEIKHPFKSGIQAQKGIEY